MAASTFGVSDLCSDFGNVLRENIICAACEIVCMYAIWYLITVLKLHSVIFIFLLEKKYCNHKHTVGQKSI